MEGSKPDEAQPNPKPNAGSDPKPSTDLERGGEKQTPPPPTAVPATAAEDSFVPAANGSPETKFKAQKSVRWSEQLVSESSYTPSVEPDTSPYPAGSNNFDVSRSSEPPISSPASFKGD